MDSSTANDDFTLGAPVLVCRWRLVDRRVPLLNRHIRALAARRVHGEPLSRSLLSWAKQHIEWSLAEDTTVSVPDDGVLMLVVDADGHAAMSTGEYVPLTDTGAEALAYRSLEARREADEVGIAPEVIACAAGDEVVLGVSPEDPLAGAASLVEQLCATCGRRIVRDPALAYRVLAGSCAAPVLLISDEHGVVVADDARGEGDDGAFAAFLVSAYEKLRRAAE